MSFSMDFLPNMQNNSPEKTALKFQNEFYLVKFSIHLLRETMAKKNLLRCYIKFIYFMKLFKLGSEYQLIFHRA